MRRILSALVAGVLLAVYAAMIVSCFRWYTDGTADCSNCDPE